MPAEPPEDLELFLEVTLASHFMHQLVRREFEADGLESYLFGLLVHVHHRGTMTPSQLAEETRVTNTTIRDQVQNLVERGLLARKPNPDDARSYLLELTSEGKRLYARGSAAHDRARERLSQELDRPLSDARSTVVELRRAAARALDAMRRIHPEVR
jgi:DNA-binding MarR family transcriptional regulator